MSERTKHNIRISQDRNISLYLGDPAHHDWITRIGKALSSPVRLKILNILKNTPRSLKEIAALLELPLSSTSLHIKALEEARLVITENQSGVHGSMRVCICSFTSFRLTAFNEEVDSSNKTVSIEMPIGNYFNCEVAPTCGIADEKGVIGAFDSVVTFYSPRRIRAQLIWFTKGFIEYRFPNLINPLLDLKEISFSAEMCSEAPGFLEDWPSDITISINNRETVTWRCPGDFGARRGKLTPAGWSNGSSQYGLLKTFSVKKEGSYLDEQLRNTDITINDLDLAASHFISLKIEVKEDAKYAGGVNIFGRKYGDYPQGIIMRVTYE